MKNKDAKKSICINQQKIRPGESVQLNLNVYRLPSESIVEIPVFVHRASIEGPTLLLIAGMHGDEINGIEVLRRLIAGSHFQNLQRGSVITIPIINVVSFVYGSRDLPDGRDLNRCFPGKRDGSLGSQIAYDLMNEVIQQIDLGIDFHTGGAKINNFPQIRSVFENPDNLVLAKKFGAPFNIHAPYREKTLRKEANKAGKTILVFEGGESLRLDQQSIQEGFNGCLRLMKNLGMLQAKVPPSESILLHKTTWVRAKVSGLFQAIKPNGTRVKQHELLGTISDPYGKCPMSLTSPVNGYIIGLNNQPVVHQGDALIHIGLAQ